MIEWIIKVLSFNIAVLVVYMIFAKPMGIDMSDFGALGKYGAFVLLGLGNIVFVLYDIAVSRMATMYVKIVRPKFKNFLK